MRRESNPRQIIYRFQLITSLLYQFSTSVPAIAKYKKWRHILVDEVQDIDPLQWMIINALCEATGASLFCVGDIDQSIYSFRGAVPEYLLDHADEFDIYRLESNYRSVPSVVEAANRLIRHNSNRLDKDMMAIRQVDEDGDEGVFIRRGLDSTFLANLLGSLNHEGRSCAVLSRTHALLKKLSMLLSESNIKHNYVGEKTELTNSEPFRRFHAFLKLIINPSDNFSFLLIRDLIGLDKEAYNQLRLDAMIAGKSHFLQWFETYDNEWVGFFDDMTCDGPSSLPEIILNLNDMLKTSTEYEPAMVFIDQWLETGSGRLDDYLSWLATYDISDEVEPENKGLQIMTIHAAKGLEFPSVIIAGCNEGILPSPYAIKSDNFEDERRLMYVAITRARDNLMLTVRPVAKEYHGKIMANPESRFIQETMTN